MPRPSPVPLLLALVLAVAPGCVSGPPTGDAPPRAGATPGATGDTVRVAPRRDSLRPRGDGSALLVPAARIGDDRITEGSGLAWAGGWWWTHNDSGDGPYLFRSRSPWFADAERIQVPGASAVDWEELAVLDGDLLVCDIGDNDRVRDDLVIYRVRPTAAGVEMVATYPVAYPDGKHDAEGVWAWNGRVHVVLKNRGEDAHWVYRFGDLRDGETNVPERIGAVTIPDGEQVTAADSNADGHVAMLTYSQLLVWPADAVRGGPRHAFTLHARQCEALAWSETGIVFTNEQRDAYLVERPTECRLDPWLPAVESLRIGGLALRDDTTVVAQMEDVPARNLRDGEVLRLGFTRDGLVLAAQLRPDTALVPSEGRIGSALLLAFGTEPRLRASAEDPRLAILLAPPDTARAVPLPLGAPLAPGVAERVRVMVAEHDGTLAVHVTIPVDALFPDGVPDTFRFALAGNGLRAGDDDPLFGALDAWSLLRPYAWAEVTID